MTMESRALSGAMANVPSESATAGQTTGFTPPFIGYLPGFLQHSEKTAPGLPDRSVYLDLLRQRWQELIDSPASRDESLIQTFLERHPCLLPGPFSVDGDHDYSHDDMDNEIGLWELPS
jgi:hypothetical protein